jgi:hypothetical protein
MKTFDICSPALIYLVFSMTQVIVDSIKGLYNVALLKFTMMVLFTLLLNILCERGLGIISWIIVFVPFILMSVITSILLFIFGLDPSSGIIKPPVSTTAKPQVIVNPKKKHMHINPRSVDTTVSERERYILNALDNVEDGIDMSTLPNHF